jgi:hypothetical protein
MEYNAKIKEAETAPKRKTTSIFPHITTSALTRLAYLRFRFALALSARMKLDTAAAGRFIQAAIPRSQRIAPGTTSSTPTPEPSKSNSKNKLTYEEVGMSSRFKHIGEGEVLDLS